jgi:hypothetical protein
MFVGDQLLATFGGRSSCAPRHPWLGRRARAVTLTLRKNATSSLAVMLMRRHLVMRYLPRSSAWDDTRINRLGGT